MELSKEEIVQQIENQIEHHKDQEENKASVKNYNEAIYHNCRIGALEDLLFWIKLQEKKEEEIHLHINGISVEDAVNAINDAFKIRTEG